MGPKRIAKGRIAYMKPAQHQAKAAHPAEALAAGAGLVRMKWSRADAFWVAAFALAVFATQIGHLAEETALDENTHCLMAAHVLDGHLPYLQFLDNKPPGIFFLLAGAMALFGEHLLVVRLVGDLSLLASCVAVFAIARRWSGRTSAGLAALLLVAVHATKHGFPTLPGIPAAAMIMAALWLLLAHRSRPPAALLAGLLLSLAVLTRTNLAVAAALLGGWLLAACFRPSLGVRPLAFAGFAMGGLLPPMALVLLYVGGGEDALVRLRIVLIDLPWFYANQSSYAQSAYANALNFLANNERWPLSFLPFTGALAVGVAASLGIGWRRRRDERALRELAWLALVGVALSVVATATRSPSRYYLLQLFPIMAVFCAHGLEWMRSQARLRLLPLLLAAIALGSALAQTLPAAVRLVGDPGYLDSRWVARKAAAALAPNLGPKDSVQAFEHPLIHWHLRTMPVSPILHIRNLSHRAVMSPLAASGLVAANELQRILDLRPTYLVLGAGLGDRPVSYLRDAEAQALGSLLADHYRLFYDQGADAQRVRIYRRKDLANNSLDEAG